jgi:ABC-type transport system substrate-binding protein
LNANRQFSAAFLRAGFGPSWFLTAICGILIGCGSPSGDRENAKPGFAPEAEGIAGKNLPPASIDPAILQSRSFREAPMLAERVASGVLPAVSDRLPENPFVVSPAERIGVYGGTLRRFIATEVIEEEGINNSLNDGLFRFENHLPGKIQPNLAESYEFSTDSRELIIRIRSGVKWSDGVDFTTADILFWYYDMTFDEEARTQPLFPSIWLVDGKPVPHAGLFAASWRTNPRILDRERDYLLQEQEEPIPPEAVLGKCVVQDR